MRTLNCMVCLRGEGCGDYTEGVGQYEVVECGEVEISMYGTEKHFNGSFVEDQVER